MGFIRADFWQQNAINSTQNYTVSCFSISEVYKQILQKQPELLSYCTWLAKAREADRQTTYITCSLPVQETYQHSFHLLFHINIVAFTVRWWVQFTIWIRFSLYGSHVVLLQENSHIIVPFVYLHCDLFCYPWLLHKHTVTYVIDLASAVCRHRMPSSSLFILKTPSLHLYQQKQQSWIQWDLRPVMWQYNKHGKNIQGQCLS